MKKSIVKKGIKIFGGSKKKISSKVGHGGS